MRFTVGTFIAVLALSACSPKVTTVMTNTSPKPHASRSADTVEVFTTKRPDRPYTEIAVLTADLGAADDHIEALRAQAGELGCDALVMTVMPGESDVEMTVHDKPGDMGHHGTGSETHSSSGTCVMYN